MLQEALPLARSVGNRWLVGYLLRLFGSASASVGDIVAARGYIAEALQNYEAVDANLSIAWAMGASGLVEFRAGNTELALRHATDALVIFRAFSSARAVVITLNSMAMYLVSLARCAEAEKRAHEALDLARAHHLDVHVANALQHLAAVATFRPRSAEERWPTVCVQSARVLGFIDARLAAMGSGREDGEQHEYDRALAVLREALGANAVAKLITEGAALTEEQAVEEALTI